MGDLWQRLHELSSRLPTVLLRFVADRFAGELVDEAWGEFTLFEEETFDPKSVHVPVFMPWFFYQWLPDPQDTVVLAEAVADFPVASAYLRRHRRREGPLAVRYLEACLTSAFSFLESSRCRQDGAS